MEYRKISMMLDDEHYIDLVFKQYEEGGDWICQIDAEFMAALEEVTQDIVEYEH